MPRYRLKRARTVRDVLDAIGLPPETIAEAEAAGTADLLAIDAVVLPDKARFTLDELAQRVGVEPEVVRAFWRALGFVDRAPEQRSYTKQDIQILKSMVELADDGFLDPEIALQVARVIGMSMSNVATAIVDANIDRAEERRELAASGDAESAAAQESRSLAVRAGELLPFMTEVIDYSFRRHLRAAAQRRLVIATSTDAETQVVGFADLVRFSELSLQLDDRELADVVGRFDALMHDVVVRHGGRVVKMIGDAAMFSAVDTAAGALIALEMSHAVAGDAQLGGLRVGVASGPILARDGDLYGPVVNVASRIAAIGRAGAINVNQNMRDALATDRRFAFRSLGVRRLRHIGEQRVYRLAGGPMLRHPAADGAETDPAFTAIEAVAASTGPD